LEHEDFDLDTLLLCSSHDLLEINIPPDDVTKLCSWIASFENVKILVGEMNHIHAAQFKPAYRRRFGSDFSTTAKKIGLESLLETHKTKGFCSIEVRPAANGASQMFVCRHISP